MSTVPERRVGRIEFYETRLEPWAAHAAAIGLSDQAVAALAARAAEARAAYEAHLAAQNAARAAAAAYHEKVDALHGAPGAGADMIRAIRAFAESTDNPEVYALARIPAPAVPAGPGAGPPPGTPTRFRVGLLQTGAIELRWTCKNPRHARGIVYEIMRRTRRGGGGSGGEEPFEFVGTTGTRRFIDTTLPAGAGPEVTYRVTALRSVARGHPAQFTVRFGVVDGAPGVRLAA